MANNTISQKFNIRRLFKFALPTIAMNVLLMLYTMVDGVFVARFVGTMAVSALNIIWPFVNVTMGIGIMLAAGGCAVVAKKMGEGKQKEALANFSFIVLIGLIISILIAIFGIVFLKEIALMLGATELLLKDACIYGFYWIILSPLTILKSIFEYFFITAGRPKLGLLTSVLGGVTNIVLDYVLIVVLNMGIGGASLASVMSEFFPCVIGLIFYCNKKNNIHFVRPSINFKMIGKACTVGFSEMITNLATGIATFLFNIVLLKYAGEDGVAAIAIIIYIDALMIGVCQGFSSGVAPVISYNYGSQNLAQIKSVIKDSMKLIIGLSVAAFALIEIFTPFLIGIFVDQGTTVYTLGVTGMHIYALGFILRGVNTFIPSMFAALSNGLFATILSFLKNLAILSAGILLLPLLFGITGVWMSVPVAESCTTIIALTLFIKSRKRYGY